MLGRGSACRGSRLIPTAACGSPAFGHYKPGEQGGFTPWSLIVLDVTGERISGMTYFLDTQTLFPRFGLPPALPA
jgi:RNA polymerase sigma-70 factor (ECF subfamily)